MEKPNLAESFIFFGLLAVMVGALAMQPDTVRAVADALTSGFSDRALHAKAEAKGRVQAYEKARGYVRECMVPKWTNHFSNLDVEKNTSCRRRRDNLWEAQGWVEYDSSKGRLSAPWLVLLDDKGEKQLFLSLGGRDVGTYQPEPPVPLSQVAEQSGYAPQR